MKNNTLAEFLLALREKEKLTQQQLASQIDSTIDHIAQWEKGLAVPDGQALQKIADVYSLPVAIFDSFIRGAAPPKKEGLGKKADSIASLILIGISLAMGAATAVLGILGNLSANSAIFLLGLGLFTLSLYALEKHTSV